MSFKVKIYGAGSIGNHLAQSCRSKGWDVLICDVDPSALDRTKNELYPSRYGKWDTAIRLSLVQDLPKEAFDLIIIGTPPDKHIPIALDVIKNENPKAILIEKPLCGLSLEGAQDLVDASHKKGIFVAVGYNHAITPHTIDAIDLISKGSLGKPTFLRAQFLEHWKGIFKAHPWLSGPKDTYLGFSQKGGGASGEHSHAINIWLRFCSALQMGRVTEVQATLDMVNENGSIYDRICQIFVKTDKGLHGSIQQDVVTEPPQKKAWIQGDKGSIEWIVNSEPGKDSLNFFTDSQSTIQKKEYPKTRPDDFKGEIDHLNLVLSGKISPSDWDSSPISLKAGLDTMMILTAAHLSHEKKRPVYINYENGYHLSSLKL